MDWSENAKLFQCWQEKSVYYHDIQISLNIAGLYQVNESTTCVGPLLDNTNNKNANLWASLKLVIIAFDLNVDELKQLYIITDISKSQYRNAGCAYLTEIFAESKEVDVSWIFTERSHGKDPMNRVGAAIKIPIDYAVVAAKSIPDVPLRSAYNVFLIINLVNIAIFLHKEQDTHWWCSCCSQINTWCALEVCL